MCACVRCFTPRISPSDVDSVVSDRSSEQETTEENLRAHTTPSDSKQTHKVPFNVLNGKYPWLHSHHSSKHRHCLPKERGREGRAAGDLRDVAVTKE